MTSTQLVWQSACNFCLSGWLCTYLEYFFVKINDKYVNLEATIFHALIGCCFCCCFNLFVELLKECCLKPTLLLPSEISANKYRTFLHCSNVACRIRWPTIQDRPLQITTQPSNTCPPQLAQEECPFQHAWGLLRRWGFPCHQPMGANPTTGLASSKKNAARHLSTQLCCRGVLDM